MFARFPMSTLVCVMLTLALHDCGFAHAAEADAKAANAAEVWSVISERKTDSGVTVYRLNSANHSEVTEVHVLLPSKVTERDEWPVVYVLPVEPGVQNRWGDPLQEILKHKLHDRFGCICVMPTFVQLPWYADHPTDTRIRQESQFLKVVVPFVDQRMPTVAKRGSRFLIGFSKSGHGAFSLLLRNPNLFDRAAAWDAPLIMQSPDKYGMGPIFGTQENFERYRIADLLRANADDLRSTPRLIHADFGNFRDHHLKIEALMSELRISRVYLAGPKRKHAWNSGWLAPLMSALLSTPATP